jgi:hypothetical protein
MMVKKSDENSLALNETVGENYSPTSRATDFTPSKIFETAVKMLRRFFANFCHEIGCEIDQTYIFRFVKYLSTFFYTYLSVNIHFQLIIITSVSILTDPAYFVPPSCHCGILILRSRDFWEITLTAKHVFGLFTWKTWKCWMRVHLNWNNHRRK